MRQNTVASLYFLQIFVIALFTSCNSGNQKDKSISFGTQKKIDSLNNYYDFALSNINDKEKKLDVLDQFLKGANELNLDSLQYKGLILQTKLLNKFGSSQKAIDQSYLLLQLAEENEDSIYIGRALYKLGLYNYKLDNYLKAFEYYNQSFKISRNIKDSTNAGKCLMAMSNIQRTLGDHNAGKTTATDGLRYLERSDQYRMIAGLSQNISVSFSELGNQEEALLWNSKILSLYKDSIAKNNIGVHNLPVFKNARAAILWEQKKYQESIDILQALLNDENVIKKQIQYAQVLSNLGYAKFLQNPKNLESETMLLEALRIRQQEKDIFGLYASNIHLTKHYRDTDVKKAKDYAHSAYETIKDVGDYEALLEVLTLITELTPDSLEDHQRFKDASLKLMELRKETREIYAPTRFENENLLKENEEKNDKIIAVRNQNVMYLLGILLLLVGIGFVVFFFKQRTRYLRQQNKIVQFQASYDTETRISKRLHDELGNDIFQVMMQYQHDPYDPQIKEKLNTTYHKARDISRENNEFETGETYAEELNNMLQNYTQNGVQLILIRFDTVDWDAISTAIKITIYRVLQELMTNMQKHSQASRVTLRFATTDNNLTIKYNDDGIGVTETHIKSANGLRNTEKRILAIGGTLIFDTEKDKGFTAVLEIPN